jgi:hypothetical protein
MPPVQPADRPRLADRVAALVAAAIAAAQAGRTAPHGTVIAGAPGAVSPPVPGMNWPTVLVTGSNGCLRGAYDGDGDGNPRRIGNDEGLVSGAPVALIGLFRRRRCSRSGQ